MRSVRLRVLVFILLLAPAIFVVRFLLATRIGIAVAVLAMFLGLLVLLYRSMKTFALAVWELSGIAVEVLEQGFHRRDAGKESSHATRLL